MLSKASSSVPSSSAAPLRAFSTLALPVSSASGSSRLARLGLFAASLFSGAAYLLSDSPSAEATASPVAPSVIPIPPASSLSADLSRSRPKSVRPPLFNPGKFQNFHREAERTLHPHIFPGGRVQAAFPMFPQEQDPALQDKQLVLLPIIQSSPEGTEGLLNVVTNLGQKHSLEGMATTQGMVVGSYQYKNRPWCFKPQFQFHPMQNAFVVDLDYKGAEWTGQLSLQDFISPTFSYTQQLTRNLSAGVQLQHIPAQMTFLNWTAKLASESKDQIFALTQKHSNWIATYYQRVHTQAPTQFSPPMFLDMAAELNYESSQKESLATLGLVQQRARFKYHGYVNSNWAFGFSIEQLLNQSVMMSFGGEMKHDGSNQNKFGFSLHIG